MKVDVGYPTASEELEIVHRMSVHPPVAHPILDPQRLVALQSVTDDVFVHHAIAEYAVRLVFATREPAQYGRDDLGSVIAFGGSPRATLGLVASARALAVLRGRDYVLPADVRDVATDVLQHRLVLSFEALADGVDVRDVVRDVIAAVAQPTLAPRETEERTA